MSLSLTLAGSAGAATRLLGRQVLGWSAAAALGAGSGYYAGSGGLETGHAEATRPAAATPQAPLPLLPGLVPATLDAPAVVEPQPPAS